jgi:hypothetical protein
MSRSGNEEFLPGNQLSEKPQKHPENAYERGARFNLKYSNQSYRPSFSGERG